MTNKYKYLCNTRQMCRLLLISSFVSQLLISYEQVANCQNLLADQIQNQVIPSSSQNDAKNTLSLSSNKCSQLEQYYQELNLFWRATYEMQSTVQEILDEGKNSPVRKAWLPYYSNNIEQTYATMSTTTQNLNSDFLNNSILKSAWENTIKEFTNLTENKDNLVHSIKQINDKNISKYPPLFWKPAQQLTNKLDSLNDSLAIFSKTLATVAPNNNSDSAAQTAMSGQEDVKSSASVSNNTNNILKAQTSFSDLSNSFKSVDQANTKITQACTGFFGELERWNLLWGNPPASGTADMFYGGGLTKEEVLSQYRYLPSMVFTTPAYVKLYSYRLAPRQNMLVYWTNKIGTLVNVMQQDLDNIQTVITKQDSSTETWEEIKRIFVDTRNQYLSLLQLVNSSSDSRLQKSIREDETTFGAPVFSIYQNMSKLKKMMTDLKIVDSH